MTPVAVAAKAPLLELLIATCRDGDAAKARELLVAPRTKPSGAAVPEGGTTMDLLDAVGADGKTPLITACMYGCSALVSLLLEHSADLNVIVVDGATPLHIAAQNGRAEIVDMLLAHDADVNIGANRICWIGCPEQPHRYCNHVVQAWWGRDRDCRSRRPSATGKLRSTSQRIKVTPTSWSTFLHAKLTLSQSYRAAEPRCVSHASAAMQKLCRSCCHSEPSWTLCTATSQHQ